MKIISRTMRNKRVTGNSQPGYSKGKSCLTKLIVFYNEMTDSVERELSMSFILTLARLLIQTLTAGKLKRRGPDGCTTM